MRLLSLTTLLILVFVLMQVAGKPSTWSWMWQIAPAATTSSPETVVSRTAGTLPSGNRPPDLDSGTYEGLLPGVDAEQLKIVRDNTFFRSVEDGVFYGWLENLGQLSGEELSKYSVGSVGFRQLLQQMPEYRGKVVHVQGTIRRCHFITAPPNSQSIAGYWRCWLFVDDAPTPIVIYSLNVPDDFPMGMAIDEPARVYGLAFKRWAFEAASGTAVAPLLLARSVDWLRVDKRDVPIKVKSTPMHWSAVAGLLVLSVGIAMLAYWGTRGSTTKQHGKGHGSDHDRSATEFLQSLEEPSGSTIHGESTAEHDDDSRLP